MQRDKASEFLSDRHAYFVTGDVVVSGVSRRAIGPDEVGSFLTQRCCHHLNEVLWRLRKHTGERFWLRLLDDPVPDAHAFSKSLDGPHEIRLTTGLLDALIALSARAAVIMTETHFLKGWMANFFPDEDELDPVDSSLGSFSGFSLSDDKRAATGLTVEHMVELEALLCAKPNILVTTLRLAATAIEFAVLHEMGHFDAGHDEARRLQSGGKSEANPSCFKPNINIQRMFEHQADIFALRLMIASADYRPYSKEMDGGAIDPQLRTEFNLACYLGAALNFTLASLYRSPPPKAGKDIDLVRQVRGEHPLPATRLRLADAQVRAEFADEKVRNMLWPDAPEFLDASLQGASAMTLYLALTTISRNWRRAVNSGEPDQQPTNMQYWMIDEGDLAESLSYITEETERELMALMLASGQRPPVQRRPWYRRWF